VAKTKGDPTSRRSRKPETNFPVGDRCPSPILGTSVAAFCSDFCTACFRAVVVGVRGVLLALVVVCVAACNETYVVGDHVLVEWDTNDYPAFVIDVEGPARYRVHYEGYDAIWDETVNVSRVKGRITGPVQVPPPPAKVARRGGAPASSSSASPSDGLVPTRFKQGQRVRVVWHGRVFHAVILEALPGERYRVHYDGFGQEWDETIEVSRIKDPR